MELTGTGWERELCPWEWYWTSRKDVGTGLLQCSLQNSSVNAPCTMKIAALSHLVELFIMLLYCLDVCIVSGQLAILH